MLSLWVTDYGLDQVADGRLFEIKLDQPIEPLPSAGETLNGTTGNDNLQATSDERWIIDGLAGNDTITTLGGNDIIRGGTGDDSIFAGAGDDLIQFKGTGLGFDTVNGGDGIDRIEAGAKGTQIGLTSVTAVELISANGFASVSVVGSAGGDFLDFTNVRLIGIAAIKGGGGNDTIYGSSTADMIDGGAGADTMRGNGGADRFDFNVVTESKVATPDKIIDFQPGVDKLDLAGVDAVSTASGNQAFSFIGTASFSNHAGELRIDASDPAKTMVLGDTNGDGIADFAIELAGNLQLSAADFFL
jgi:Ca2+-binding RTX toxin-like protein